MSLIPHDASVPVKDTFRAVWKAIDALDIARKDVNLHGHRLLYAGDAHGGSEFVTLRQLHKISEDQAVAHQVRIIVQKVSDSPWKRVNTATLLVNTADQVGIGLTSLPSTVPSLHIRGSSGAVGTFPTIGASAELVLENNAALAFAFVIGATNAGNIQWFGSGDTAEDGEISYSRNTRAMTFKVAATNRVRITSAGSLLCQVQGALATTATDGFLYVPSCAGTPTGVPTAQTGMIPLVYDSTNNILYAYSGGAWRTH